MFIRLECSTTLDSTPVRALASIFKRCKIILYTEITTIFLLLLFQRAHTVLSLKFPPPFVYMTQRMGQMHSYTSKEIHYYAGCTSFTTEGTSVSRSYAYQCATMQLVAYLPLNIIISLLSPQEQWCIVEIPLPYFPYWVFSSVGECVRRSKPSSRELCSGMGNLKTSFGTTVHARRSRLHSDIRWRNLRLAI